MLPVSHCSGHTHEVDDDVVEAFEGGTVRDGQEGDAGTLACLQMHYEGQQGRIHCRSLQS